MDLTFWCYLKKQINQWHIINILYFLQNRPNLNGTANAYTDLQAPCQYVSLIKIIFEPHGVENWD